MINDVYGCTGCLACADACNTNAVSVCCDVDQGYYPIVNTEKCISCGNCKNVCPLLITEESNLIKSVYAAWSNDDAVLQKSSSGGIAYEISQFVFNEGGSVYGAVFEGTKLVHIRADNIETINRFCGSKYVQSCCTGIYRSIKEDLQQGKKVLFIGTGCQVAAVKSFIPESLQENLFLIDLLCHGTPSPRLFETYVDKITKHNKVDDISFREGRNLKLSITYSGNTYEKPFYLDDYYLAFEIGANLRKCCYSCPYASETRYGDITLGDFHSITKEQAAHKIDKGTSMVCINTEKGKRCFNSIRDKVITQEFELSVANRNNPQLSNPPVEHKMHKTFLSICKNNNEADSLHKCMRSSVIKYTVINKLAENILVEKALTLIGK